MQTSANRIGRPPAGDHLFPLPEDFVPASARQRSPLSQSGGIELTPKGERYVAEHIGAGTDTKVPRAKIERAIDRHLSLVTVLLALLDDADGDENLEPSLGEGGDGSLDDRELDAGDDREAFCDDQEPFEPTHTFPNGAHLSGGGSGI